MYSRLKKWKKYDSIWDVFRTKSKPVNQVKVSPGGKSGTSKVLPEKC